MNPLVSVVLQGDALNLPLADASVDLVVTSPPYFALRSYQDDGAHYDGQVGSEDSPQEFLEALWAATREMMRVLKPEGSIFVNLGDKYAGSGGHNNSGISPKSTLRGNGHVGGGPKIRETPRGFTGGGGAERRAEQREASRRQAPDRYNKATIGGARAKSLMGLPWRYAIGCVDDLGLILRAELIWAKPNGLPESVTDRVARRHEQWFHFTKQGSYFAAMDAIREPYESANRGPVTPYTANGVQRHGLDGSTLRNQSPNPLGKLPSSVWTIASEPLRVPRHLEVDHFAAFPTEWPRRLILGWCPEGGTVLDPFGGTGNRGNGGSRPGTSWHLR